jgi:hypothetical protein
LGSEASALLARARVAQGADEDEDDDMTEVDRTLPCLWLVKSCCRRSRRSSRAGVGLEELVEEEEEEEEEGEWLRTGSASVAHWRRCSSVRGCWACCTA